MHRRRHVCGMHAVRTLLTVRPASVHEVSVADSRSDRRCASIIDMASAADIPVHILPRHELDQLQPGVRHQGVIASVDRWIATARSSISRVPPNSPVRVRRLPSPAKLSARRG